MLTLVQIHNGPSIRGSRDEIRINCLDCNDTKFHCYVNLKKMLYFCQHCGAKGKIKRENDDVNNFTETIEDYKNSLEQVPLKYKLDLNSLGVRSLPINSCLEVLPDKGTYMIVYNYLRSRGLTNEDIADLDIRVSLEKEGKYSNCIIIPVYKDDKLVYFVSRKYNGDKPKYVNAPWPKGDILFHYEVSNSPNWVIVEGIFDAIAVAKSGYNAMALLGKQITGQQLMRIGKENKNSRIVLNLDNDAFDKAVDLGMKLNNGLNISTCLLTCEKDAADMYLLDKGKSLREKLHAAFAHLQEKCKL